MNVFDQFKETMGYQMGKAEAEKSNQPNEQPELGAEERAAIEKAVHNLQFVEGRFNGDTLNDDFQFIWLAARDYYTRAPDERGERLEVAESDIDLLIGVLNKPTNEVVKNIAIEQVLKRRKV